MQDMKTWIGKDGARLGVVYATKKSGHVCGVNGVKGMRYRQACLQQEKVGSERLAKSLYGAVMTCIHYCSESVGS